MANPKKEGATMNFKNFFGFILVAFTAALLSACGGGSNVKDSKNECMNAGPSAKGSPMYFITGQFVSDIATPCVKRPQYQQPQSRSQQQQGASAINVTREDISPTVWPRKGIRNVLVGSAKAYNALDGKVAVRLVRQSDVARIPTEARPVVKRYGADVYLIIDEVPQRGFVGQVGGGAYKMNVGGMIVTAVSANGVVFKRQYSAEKVTTTGGMPPMRAVEQRLAAALVADLKAGNTQASAR